MEEDPWVNGPSDAEIQEAYKPLGEFESAAQATLEPHIYQADFQSQGVIEKLLGEREEILAAISKLDKLKKIGLDRLFDLDFDIDCKFRNDLKEFGLKLLTPDIKREPGFGSDIDMRSEFHTKEERSRETARGKGLVDEKITNVVEKLMKVNSNVQNSQNFRVIALVNEMLRKATRYTDKLLAMSEKHPDPYPPTNPLAFPGKKPFPYEVRVRGRPGAGKKVWDYEDRVPNAIAQRKALLNPDMTGLPVKEISPVKSPKKSGKKGKFNSSWYGGSGGFEVGVKEEKGKMSSPPKQLSPVASDFSDFSDDGDNQGAAFKLPSVSQLEVMEEMYTEKQAEEFE